MGRWNQMKSTPEEQAWKTEMKDALQNVFGDNWPSVHPGDRVAQVYYDTPKRRVGLTINTEPVSTMIDLDSPQDIQRVADEHGAKWILV